MMKVRGLLYVSKITFFLKAFNFLLAKALFAIPDKARKILCFETVSWLGRLLTPPLRFKDNAPRYLNLGCGDNIIDGFINIDFFTARSVDYGADLRSPLKLASAVVDGILCEHTLEHLTYSEVDKLLKECFRVLKPGAIMRIGVPDLSVFIRNYCNQNRDWFSKWEELMFINSPDEHRAQRRLISDLEAVSFITQEYGHVSCWDHETLNAYLCQAGFRSSSKRQFRDGDCMTLLEDLDADDRKFVSVYVEAIK